MVEEVQRTKKEDNFVTFIRTDVSVSRVSRVVQVRVLVLTVATPMASEQLRIQWPLIPFPENVEGLLETMSWQGQRAILWKAEV